MDNEIGKYIKKKESNTSKAGKKAKHKHIYKDCILINVGRPYMPNKNVFLGNYCEICGKVDNWRMVWDVERNGPYEVFSRLTDEQIKEQYKHLPQFEVDNICKVEKVNVDE